MRSPKIGCISTTLITTKTILAELLRKTIERDRFPPSPRIKSVTAIPAKLDPSAPWSEPLPTGDAPEERSMVLHKKRRR